jgi:inhibitor of cysteine peptidase
MFTICLAVLLSQNMYTETDANKKIELSNGDEFVIKLTSNPSTGYQWILEENDHVKQVGKSHFEEINKDKDVTGAPVTQVLKFKVVKSGNFVLTLRYRRVWEPKDTDKAFKLLIKVK